MKLRTLDIAAATSLLVFIVTLWLCARDFLVIYESKDGFSNAFNSHGSVYLKQRTARDFSMETAQSFNEKRLLGFGIFRGVRADGESETWYIFHVWPLILLSVLAPIIWSVRYRRARRLADRLARGRCTDCGYDCRATPDRCPECGAATPTQARPRTGESEGKM